jgi:hypothetical protein
VGRFKELRNGRELEFSGGITFGVAKEFASFVDALGSLELVHLNSRGGRIEEAQRIGNIIKAHDLNTYVASACESACTILFLSGRQRLITSESKVGFHQPDFPGMSAQDRREAIATEEARLESLGVSNEFARKANLEPPNRMWFPTTEELLSSGVATKLVDESDFAISGISPADLNREKIENELSKIELYAAVKKVDPEVYKSIIDRFFEGARRGDSVAEMREDIGPLITNIFENALPNANDDDITLFANSMTKIGSQLRGEDPAECYAYFNPDQDRSSLLVEVDKRHPDIFALEQTVRIKIIGDSNNSTTVPSTKQSILRSLSSVLSTLKGQGGIDWDVLQGSTVPPNKYDAYCYGLIALYQEALKLPKHDGAALIRYLVTSKQ